jgi:diguanylate cyclase (GGDEF)-like protein
MLVNVSSRAGLVFLAWGPWFPRAYPLLGTLLISLCHGLWAFLCSREVLGAHPEFLAALVTDAFAAYFFCGLQFRQALAVNAFAAMGLVLGSFYHANQLTPVLPYAVILLTNMVMAAIAGFGQERSARNSFIEHSLLGELAARDGLTGLKNRRSLDEHLERVWKQAIRDRRRLALLMVDVDHFKRYNDLYGHQAGDRALKCVASVVETFAKRPLDIAARYGGEELVVVLYDTAQTHVTEIAERVVHAVHALRIEHEGSNEGVVTVSIGAALIPPTPQRSSQGALQLADQALYEAKRAGRNKVIVLEQEYDSLATGIFRSIAAAG